MSTDSTVSITWSSKDEELVRSLQKIQQGFDKLDSRLDKVEKSGRRTANVTRGIGGAAKDAVGYVTGLATAYFSIGSAINLVTEANRKFRSEAEAAGKKSDEAFREFGILTGLRGEAFEAARARIRHHAEAIPLSSDPTGFAARAATQLASSGFSNEDASGAALRAFLEVMVASGEQDNPEGLAQALSQYMSARGMKKDAANVKLVGREFQRMSLASDTGIADLNALAKETGSISGQLTPQEEFASFQQLRAALGAEGAAVQLRNITSRLATASAFKDKTEALARLGLKPTDVDFVGENEAQILELLDKGLQSVPEAERAPILTKLFETQGVAAAKILVENRKAIEDEMKLSGDYSKFDETVEFATSGRVMAERRQLVRRETRRSRADDIDDLLIGSINEVLEREGHGPIDAAAREKVHEHLRAYGLSRDASLQALLPLIPDVDVLTEAKLKLAEDAGHDPEIVNKLFSAQEQRRLRAGAQLKIQANPTLDEVNQLRRDTGLVPFTQEQLDRQRQQNQANPIDPDLRRRMLRGLNDPPPDGQTAQVTDDRLMQRQNEILARIEQNTRSTSTGPVKAHRNKPPSSRLSRGADGSIIS